MALWVPLFIAGYLLFTDWRLALAALTVAPMALLASYLCLRNMAENFAQYQVVERELTNTTVEYLRNLAVMKLFGQDSERFQRLAAQLKTYYQLVEVITRRTVPGWALFCALLGANLLLLMPIAISRVATGVLSPAEVMMAVILAFGMLKPLLEVSQISQEFGQLIPSLNPLAQIYAFMPEPDSAADSSLKNLLASVQFEKLNFRYHADEAWATRDLNLSLAAGTTTVLVGPSGSGKSTLAQLLTGLISPTQGAILINQLPLSKMSQAQRAAWVVLASQQPFLFQGTLRENLMLGCKDAPDEAIATALTVAQAQTLIAELPDGLNTWVGEGGTRLSGGEKQRIALARALLSPAPVLLLDEATAFADNITQAKFYQALQRHYRHRTVLLIAHRLVGLEQADQIVMMEKGRIVAKGSHQTLLAQTPCYQQMWQQHQQAMHWQCCVTEDQEVCDDYSRA
ncbi:Iron import ATP-binding/permease protein IrtB [Vibrio stylophorae]|uniref:Iron import ATP-binding/permease protein IrtB n=2 Tax=Vibrio stylophorae TaxID=659351 RepID=A0ABM8ZR72_9VIBR|nr:Iron import ATP-binding/permease protein IrtB [Vibrio stylophorae]